MKLTRDQLPLNAVLARRARALLHGHANPVIGPTWGLAIQDPERQGMIMKNAKRPNAKSPNARKYPPPIGYVRSVAAYQLQVYATAHGLNADDVACLLGVAPQTAGNWLKRWTTPDLVLAVRIQDVCGIEPRNWTIAYDPAVHQQAA